MKLKQALNRGAENLIRRKDVEDPKFESELLLRHVLNISRAQLFLDLEKEMDPEIVGLFDEWIKRRSLGEPIAYIIKCREFFGLDFYVDRRVLIPRPETELLVEQAITFSKNLLKRVLPDEIVIADIGTGSGAVAISLVVNIPQARIYAIDISTSALEVAAINCRKNKVIEQIKLVQGDLLNPLPETVDVLIANLPYVTRPELAQLPHARYEPHIALDGGETGLDKIFQLCGQLKGKVKPGGCVLLEVGLGQDKEAVKLLSGLFPSSEIKPLVDLAGVNRAIKISLR